MVNLGEVRIEQEIGNWTVEFYWIGDDIQAGPTRVVVRPTDESQPPVGGVSSTILRQINFRAAAAEARETVATKALTAAPAEEADEEMPPKVAMPLLKAILDTGGVTEVYLVLLATEYLARVARGEAKPVDHIAEDLGRSLGTVKNHLWRARNEGLLKGGSAGRKGGYVPPEATRIALDWLNRPAAAAAEKIEVEMPPMLILVDEDPAKPKRRRPPKAIAQRDKT